MKNYDEKVAWFWKSPNFIGRTNHGGRIWDLHHKMRNTKGNRKRYPLLIDSILNLELVEHSYHIDHHGQCGKMTDLEAAQYERFLSKSIHKRIAAFVNNPVGKMF